MNQKNIGMLLIFVSLVLIVVLGFVKMNIDAQQNLICDEFHSSESNVGKSCKIHQDNTSWLVLVAFGVAIVFLAGGAYFMLSKDQQAAQSMVSIIETANKRKNFQPVDENKLDAEEKKVLELLKQNNGSMYQSDLIKETGFTKVKTTRVLDKLSLKEVIDRKRRGMTNIIVLK